jgi:hypothetical protein
MPNFKLPPTYNTNCLTLLQSSLRHVIFWLGIASRVPSFKRVLVAHRDLRNWRWGLAGELGKLTVALCRNFHLLLDLVLGMVLAHFRSLDSILDDCVPLTPLKCVEFVNDTAVRCFREVVANRDILVIYCTVGNGSSNSLGLLAEL